MLSGKHRFIAILGLSASFMLSSGCGKPDSATQHFQLAEKSLEENIVNLYIWSDYL